MPESQTIITQAVDAYLISPAPEFERVTALLTQLRAQGAIPKGSVVHGVSAAPVWCEIVGVRIFLRGGQQVTVDRRGQFNLIGA
jgi:hypothetical protein